MQFVTLGHWDSGPERHVLARNPTGLKATTNDATNWMVGATCVFFMRYPSYTGALWAISVPQVERFIVFMCVFSTKRAKQLVNVTNCFKCWKHDRDSFSLFPDIYIWGYLDPRYRLVNSLQNLIVLCELIPLSGNNISNK